MEVVGLSTHADDGGGEGRTLRFRLSARAHLSGPLWGCNTEGERVVMEIAGSSPASSVPLAGFGRVERQGGILGPGPRKC